MDEVFVPGWVVKDKIQLFNISDRMDIKDIDVFVASEEHLKYAPIICQAIETAAYARGTGIAKRKPEYIENKMKVTGKVLADILDGYVESHASVGEVRHIGLFSAIELVKDKETREPLVPFGKDPEGIMPKILGMLKADGFWTYSHENMIVVCPPLTITEEELREQMAIMDKVLDSVDQMI